MSGRTVHDSNGAGSPGTDERPDPLEIEGPAAPPRANGELVFTAPWQSRLFATTMRLYENDHFEWDEFRQGLIDQIAIHQDGLSDAEDYDYWGCWQRSLEGLVTRLELVSRAELDRSAAEIAALPPGHDHGHDHSHDHAHDHDHSHDHAHDHGHANDHGEAGTAS